MAEPREVVWSDRALADVEAAYSYFLEKSPSYAAKFLREVDHAADSLAHLSERGPVTIARLIHGRRDFKSTWKSRP